MFSTSIFCLPFAKSHFDSLKLPRLSLIMRWRKKGQTPFCSSHLHRIFLHCFFRKCVHNSKNTIFTPFCCVLLPHNLSLELAGDMVSCFNEAAMNISLSSCSSNSKSACVSPKIAFSRQNSVICLYKIILSTQKQIFITVTWCKNSSSHGFSVSSGKSFNTNSPLFKKKKGSRVYESDNSKLEVVWDLSDAKYDNGAEPEDGFCVFVLVDSELALILGKVDEEALHPRFESADFPAKVSLVYRREEHSSGHTLYSTKAQLCSAGIKHRISIRFTDENEGLKNPGLLVCVDEKTVVCVKRLQWNFRGNQTIFVDGLLVDLFWNVHDFLFRPVHGYAVFMFRTRNGIDSRFRLWMEEKVERTEEESVEFSLLIFSSKIS